MKQPRRKSAHEHGRGRAGSHIHDSRPGTQGDRELFSGGIQFAYLPDVDTVRWRGFFSSFALFRGRGVPMSHFAGQKVDPPDRKNPGYRTMRPHDRRRCSGTAVLEDTRAELDSRSCARCPAIAGFTDGTHVQSASGIIRTVVRTMREDIGLSYSHETNATTKRLTADPETRRNTGMGRSLPR